MTIAVLVLPILVTGGTIGDSTKTVGMAMAEALEADFRTPVRWIEMAARNTYENAGEWEEKARKLATLFIENFKQYEDNDEGRALAKAGPKI